MTTVSDWNHRGYTGHEMLDSVQLIHMKGRVYDPTLGMFLSPDPVLNSLRMPQSLNPYGYVAGNPLAYTDPSGYSPCGCSADGAGAGMGVMYVTASAYSLSVSSFVMLTSGAAGGFPAGFPAIDFGLDFWDENNSITASTAKDKQKKEMDNVQGFCARHHASAVVHENGHGTPAPDRQLHCSFFRGSRSRWGAPRPGKDCLHAGAEKATSVRTAGILSAVFSAARLEARTAG